MKKLAHGHARNNCSAVASNLVYDLGSGRQRAVIAAKE